ncbi:phosphoenolpyruvate--protein phosphotransferase [Desulfosudis oleivorans]|uniref:Phosphoenolpyruvate-protein phosphotransferase n=1 Tax=Desulfosudis oleivorans (strain DSM 6200 / JCM 39069 / Hxd3) TaxID=96561 RepID=A8ZXC2_DESOH|nr:phosphoenolpyruvate--protein phosphotransferase [Desulfosudis oleivorans]ABW68501.1 phosphoenolpyruvate-protein phosphotransferase [Desulfosudis oleivorans Hxd3]
MTDGRNEIKLVGVAGSPGICIGKAYLIDTDTSGVEVVEKYFIDSKNISKEVNRFKAAVKKAKDELSAIIKDVPEDLQDHVHILETHMVMFKDKMLYGKTIETIENEQVNAEWALKKTVADVREMFRDIADPYIKGRVTDIAQVTNRIMQQLLGTTTVDIGKIDKRVILVAHDLSPADTSQIQLDKIKGFVTDRGGRTSHTAIIAKTLDIPSVLGMENATKMIRNDDIIIVDGESGIVIVNPTDESIIKYQNREQEYEAYKIDVAKSSHLPVQTVDGVSVKVLANIELPAEIGHAKEYGADGIGLFRTEFLYLSRKEFPTEEELFLEYRKVVETMAPKPVTIRTLDINGDKVVAYDQTEEEANPALGLRAIRFCLKRPEVFQTQLRAILRASAFGNVKVMFPLISAYEEMVQAREALDTAADSLKKDGLAYNGDIEVGAMIEVPATVIIADMLADIVDFFSIGTNDLVQYSLAIDRGNRQVAHLFQTFHPAVIRMIRQVIEVGKSKGVDVVMCGEMAGFPINLPILLGLGLERLSMNPPAIPIMKNAIRSMKAGDTKSFMDEVFTKNTAAQISDLVHQRFGDLFPSLPDITQ